MYKITLRDGTVLDKLTLNGNNFIAQGIIDNAVFEGNLGHVTITDDETGISDTYDDMILIQNTEYGDGRSWFVLAEKTKEQELSEDIDEMIVDYEYRITMLELDLTE